MRVGIIALLHESNTFIRQPTTIEHFRESLLVTGEAVREKLAASHHEVGGMFTELAESSVEAVPLFAARAIPYGPVSADTFEWLLRTLWEQLESAGPLDGLLVAPHGATVSEKVRDADGFWLAELRARFGPKRPIIGTLDPHANLSPTMVAATDALVAYRTNPHLDQHERGREAARLMVRTLRGEIEPKQAASFPPIAINIERQNTSETHCRDLYAVADQMLRRQANVLSNSILLGFPYADVEEMGSAAIVVVDGDPALAQRLADELGSAIWDRRESFVGQLVPIDEAVERCRNLPGPVCLLDMGDNVGGGSPGDGTHLAHALRRHGVGPSCVCLYDPEVARQATASGIGSRITAQIGGKSDERHGAPLSGSFEVVHLSDGVFEEPEARHGGFTRFDQGPSAVLRGKTNMTIIVTSRRVPPFSLRQLTSCGVDPTQFQVLVAKGVNAPVAAYAPVCPHMIRVNTPGVTCANMVELPFHHRRQPMYPFERNTDWHSAAE